MEKSIVKKKLHLKPDEKKYVAKMIDNGGTLEDVDRWYQMRFGKKITKSVYYRLKEQCKTILADKNDMKKTNKYTRKGEKDLAPFEEHLKIKIAEKLESTDSFHWTYLLLQNLNAKLMFYPVNNILNQDETGLNYLETRGRIICEKGKRVIFQIFTKILC